MDCAEFQKCVGLYSDGELDEKERREAADHVAGCSECSARASEIAVLKSAVRRVYKGVSAPQGLRRRIQSSLEADVATSLREREPATRRSRVRTRLRVLAPIGLAAAILATAVLWWQWPSRPRHPGRFITVSGKVVDDIREQHRRCVLRRGVNHHDETLPRDLRGIASRLSAELQLAVIAPDYSAQGFELVGADRCGIMGRAGAHILYHSATDVALSVYTVARIATFGGRAGAGNTTDEYYVSWDEPLGVVAWHTGPQTHAICANLPRDRLLDLAVGGRTATAEVPGPTWSPPRALVWAR
jgi:anti-sigma factor (TIGR02949 family)